MGSILECDGITKKFGGLIALDNVSFKVDTGEIFGIIGPNGSGKTTLLNVISGLLKPERGRVYFNGTDITNLKPHERVALGISRVFQGSRVYYYLPVYYNVVLTARSVLKDPRLARTRTTWALTLTGLLSEVAELPTRLTPYKLRMLELARAIVTRPRLILLDEPFAGLSQEEIENFISIVDYFRRSGTTFIIVEHKLRYLMKIADRVIVLNNGVKIFEGPPKEAVKNEEVIRAYLGVAVGAGT